MELKLILLTVLFAVIAAFSHVSEPAKAAKVDEA
jgi:hypothetical protein